MPVTQGLSQCCQQKPQGHTGGALTQGPPAHTVPVRGPGRDGVPRVHSLAVRRRRPLLGQLGREGGASVGSIGTPHSARLCSPDLAQPPETGPGTLPLPLLSPHSADGCGGGVLQTLSPLAITS